MDYTLIELQVTQGIALLTLNRPDKRNAMSDGMRSEFIHALERITADKSIQALVLTGAGKGFCAGGDISGMQQRMNAPAGEVGFNGWHRQQRVHHAQSLLHTCPKPVIAAVNGAASGLGADTALACDFIIASEWASFTWSYIHRGIIPDGGGMYFLPRRVGLSMAKQLILSKTILNQTFELTSHDVFAQGSQAQGICYTSSEHRAAVAAFLAKTGR
ncbi:MAG: enoyl-CoA hydratase/isomerase family protein [Betaproteobacteria bacterium]|nr:enoyl-CoA hydratase/isomerase family protein [Betaproteobacteria bacterium]